MAPQTAFASGWVPKVRSNPDYPHRPRTFSLHTESPANREFHPEPSCLDSLTGQLKANQWILMLVLMQREAEYMEFIIVSIMTIVLFVVVRSTCEVPFFPFWRLISVSLCLCLVFSGITLPLQTARSSHGRSLASYPIGLIFPLKGCKAHGHASPASPVWSAADSLFTQRRPGTPLIHQRACICIFN